MAIKKRYVNTPKAAPYGYYQNNDGNTQGWSSYEVYANDIQDGWSDSDWKTKVAYSQNASLPYKRLFHEYNPPLVSMSHGYSLGNVSHFYTGWRYFWGAYAFLNAPSSDSTSDDVALRRFKNKLSDHTDEFKALIPLAEINKTRSLIRTTISGATDLINELIKIKHGRGSYRKVRRAAANAYLNFQFGIKPTISDTTNLINSIGTYLSNPRNFIRIVAGDKVEWVSNHGGRGQQALNSACNLYYRDAFSSNSRIVTYTGGFDIDIRASNFYGINSHFGLSFSDLPGLLWEITPYSWVLDYFGTIGAYLEDVFSSVPGTTVYLTKSVKHERTTSQSYTTATGPYIPYPRIGKSGTVTSRSTAFERSVLTALPHAGLRFKTVDEIGKNSLSKLLNLSAILVAR